MPPGKSLILHSYVLFAFLKSILINSNIHVYIHKNRGEKSQHNRYPLGEGKRMGGIDWEFGIDMYTLLYLK